MADNVSITPGTGRTIAADDVGGIMFQRVKLALGADGTAVDAVAGAGAVGTGVQRVTLASDDPATVALQVIDDWDEGDRAKVNLIVGQAGISAGNGAVAANTPRVTHASDDPVTVGIQIMDDWDETDRCKVNLIPAQAGITGGAGAVAANTPRVTLASDDPATVALQIIDDWDETDRCKVNLVVGQAGVAAGAGAVGANTPRVTLASDDPAVALLRGPATGTITSVNDVAVDATVLASNANRKGATFFNDSTATLYLAMANVTASTTVYSVQIPAGGFYELPVCQGGVYTGIIKGIWSSDASGAVRVTELT